MKVKSKVNKLLTSTNGINKTEYIKDKIYNVSMNNDKTALFVRGIGFYDWKEYFEIMEE